MTGSRTDRVAEGFREILAEEILKLKDPRVGFVTVTHVEVTPDLRRAVVFYTVLGEDRDHRSTRAALRSAQSHLRATIGRQVRLKFTPELEFHEDPGAGREEHVQQLLEQLERQAPPHPGGDAGGD